MSQTATEPFAYAATYDSTNGTYIVGSAEGTNAQFTYTDPNLTPGSGTVVGGGYTFTYVGAVLDSSNNVVGALFYNATAGYFIGANTQLTPDASGSVDTSVDYNVLANHVNPYTITTDSPRQEISAGGPNADTSIIYDVPAVYGQGGFASLFQVDAYGIGDSVTLSAADFGPNAATDSFSEGYNGDHHDFYVADNTTGESISFTLVHSPYSETTGVDDTIGNGPDQISITDNAGNIVFYDNPTCFYPGTLIRTPAGESPVESLHPGDLVTLSDGRAAPISWLGRQTVSTRFADPMRVLPIRIKAGALAESTPARDLLISPDHAIRFDNILIQAGALVNGVSITRDSNVPETFTYYHVEVADHSLILAENTPAETFVDNVDRMAFDNWHEHQALEADTIPEMDYPRARSARQVPQAMRARLMSRAAQIHGAEIATAA